MHGNAADIWVEGMTSEELEPYAKKAGFTFTKTYDDSSHLHVDVRKTSTVLLSGRTDVQEYVKAEVFKHGIFRDVGFRFNVTKEDIHNLVFAIMHIENRGRNVGTSEAGARGIMQIMNSPKVNTWDTTVTRLIQKGILLKPIDYKTHVDDPKMNILVGVGNIARIVERMNSLYTPDNTTKEEFLKFVAAGYVAGENRETEW